jgi:RNA polymerase sigma-70 factor (ECF subfamily)
LNADERPHSPSRGEETDDVLAKLVRDARDGDERSFGRLAERVRARVYRWALAGTGDADEAEDVAQDVLLRLHRHLESFEGRSRFDTWLYRITSNAAASARRRAQRHGSGSSHGHTARTGAPSEASAEVGTGAVLEPRAEDPLESAATLLDAQLDASRVAELIGLYCQALPTRQREVFDLVDLQGYAPRDVAEMMQMNPTTVRAHLFKARRTIRDHILRRHPERVEDYA